MIDSVYEITLLIGGARHDIKFEKPLLAILRATRLLARWWITIERPPARVDSSTSRSDTTVQSARRLNFMTTFDFMTRTVTGELETVLSRERKIVSVNWMSILKNEQVIPRKACGGSRKMVAGIIVCLVRDTNRTSYFDNNEIFNYGTVNP